MRTDRVVVTPPGFDHDLRFFQGVEDFAVEQFVAQLAVEAFAVTILPRTSWLDVGSLRANGGDPLAQSNSNKLRAVV